MKVENADDAKREVRKGLQETRDKEVERYENLIYAFTTGCIVLALGLGEYCARNDIDLTYLKWLLILTIIVSGVVIIALLISGVSSIKCREYGMDAMDNGDPTKCAAVEKYNNAVGMCNNIVYKTFVICPILALASIIWVFFAV